MAKNKKKKEKKPKQPRLNRSWEGPNDHARQHDVYLIEEVDGIKRTRNITQLPLDYYYTRQLINEKQYLAGTKFFYLWYYGAEKNFLTSGLFAPLPGEKGGQPNYEKQAQVQEDYYSAYDAIRGWRIRSLCHSVCCLCNFAAIVTLFGKNHKMPRLREGLDDLAKHFGIR